MIRDADNREVLILTKETTIVEEDSRIRVKGVDLGETELPGGEISDLVLDYPNLEELVGRRMRIINVDFDGGTISDADFREAVFRKVSFYTTEMLDTRFDGAEFSDCEFLGANLGFSSFKNCRFERVRFTSDNTGHLSSLEGAKLSDTDLSSVEFAGALFDESTEFPRSFLPNDIPGLQLASGR